MTWGTDPQRTDATAIVQRGPDSTTADTARTPGKNTRTQGMTDWERNGAACDVDGMSKDCVMTSEERRRVVESVRERIMMVSVTYQSAANAVRVQKLMEKDADLSWVLSLMLDVVAGALASKLVSVFQGIRSHSIATGHSMYDETETSTSLWRHVSEASIASGVATAAAGAKALAVSRVTAHKTSASTDQKADTQAFLMDLIQGASVGFEHLRDNLSAIANDAQLLVYDVGFSAEYHDQRTYEQALLKKIDDYHKSGANRIGKTPTTGAWQARAGGGEALNSTNIGVVWQDYASGYRSRLVYESYQGAWHHGDEKAVSTWEGGDVPPTGIPSTRMDSNAQSSDGKFFVPEEFEDTAVQRHRVTWGEEPKRKFVDDSGNYWEPERAAKAKAEMAKRSSSPPNKVVPKLDLTPTKPVASVTPPKPVEPPIVVPDALKLKPDVGGTL